MSLAVLYRQVQEVPPDKWEEFLKLEEEIERSESAAGHPLPRRYRAMFGGEHSHIRVCERIYEGMALLGRLTEERFQNEKLQRLDARKHRLLQMERNEVYYIDSGNPVPKWMQGISRKPFDPAHISCAIPQMPFITASDEELRRNREEGKIRVMYRQIQLVPRELWAEKLEQERLSDIAEAKAGNPVPLRYRVMYGTENSHIRVSEREYDRMEDICRSTENFFAESDAEQAMVMDAEARRQAYFAWEREELYYVDSDSFIPTWVLLISK